MERIGIILVVYNFNSEHLQIVLKALCEQADCVCVVDNSSTDSSSIFNAIDRVVYMPQTKNIGIAAAQNVGIRYLMDNGFDYIVFSDQDSIIADGTIQALYNTYNKLLKEGYKVGAVGPRAYNTSTGNPYPHQCNKLGEIRLDDNINLTEVTYTMSSLSFQHTDTFRDVGLMDASLFIDGTDSEWCWRGKKQRGLRYFVNEDIHINHMLGLGLKSVGGKQISITPPYRMFYMYRNYLWLASRSYTPYKWRLYNGMKYILKAIYYPLFQTPRKDYIKFIYNGIVAGLRKHDKS